MTADTHASLRRLHTDASALNSSSSSDSSGGNDKSPTTLIVVLAVTALAIALMVGAVYLCRRRQAKRLQGGRNSHSQSTEYMDYEATPTTNELVEAGAPRTSSTANLAKGNKWFSHLPRLSSLPSMELMEQLALGLGGSSSASVNGTIRTLPSVSTLSLPDYQQDVEQLDPKDALAAQALAVEQCRLPPTSVTEGELLHEGMLTLVFRATLQLEGQPSRPVVVRRLQPELLEQRLYRDAFMAEVALSATLVHPRIVGFVGFYDRNQIEYDLDAPSSPSHHVSQASCPAAVTEFMPNGDLRALLTLRPRNPKDFGWFHAVSLPKSKAQLALDVVDALVYLHSRPAGVCEALHPREIKAQRVLLSDQCEAKLCAFGVRRALGFQAEYVENDSSVAWLAPELLRGEAPTEQSDVYALGVLFTELDTCELPFAAGVDMDGGGGENQLALLVSSGSIRPSLAMDCPVPVHELVTRCLSFSPSQRPRAVDVQQTLRRLLKSRSVCKANLATLPSVEPGAMLASLSSAS